MAKIAPSSTRSFKRPTVNPRAYRTAYESLPDMSRDELKRLRTDITALLNVAGGKTDDHEPDDVRFAVWIICEQLRSRGIEFANEGMLRQHRDFRKFKQHYEGVVAYFNHAQLNKLQRRTMLEIGVRLLYDNLCDMGVPVTALVLMRNIYRVPACINKELPGYAENGLLKMAVR